MTHLVRAAAVAVFAAVLLPALADDKPAADKQDAKPGAPQPADKPDAAKKDADKPDAPKKDGDKPDTAKKDETPKKDGDKKDTKKDAKKSAEKHANTEKSVKGGQVSGKVQSVDETKKTLKLQVDIPYTKPNVGAANAVAQARVDYQLALARRDANGMADAQRRIAYHSAQQVTVEVAHKDLEVTTTDDVKVRLNNPPSATDEKGKVRRHTEKELKELKGDPKLPGYQGEFSSLRQGQTVTVYLVKDKDAPKPKPGAKAKEAEDPLAGFHLQASMIVIVVDPPN
jgi:hypothetical protein